MKIVQLGINGFHFKVIEDKIFVLKNGEIVDYGNHDLLIKNCDEYKSLYQKQLK